MQDIHLLSPKNEWCHCVGQPTQNPLVSTLLNRSYITFCELTLTAQQPGIEEMEQARVCFADHMEKIDQLNPDGWNNESLRQDLSRSLSVLDLAEDEYEQAMTHFASSGRGTAVSGGSAPKSKRSHASVGDSELLTHFRNGFAYNLPLVLLGIIAMIVYLLK